jgi:ribosomal protein RSM22 (predicted rRNA methylase)
MRYERPMGDAMRDLEKWIPRLLAVWRRRRSGAQRGRSVRHERPPPQAQLTPEELREVGAGVKALSHGLTRERNLAGARYMDDPTLLGAYLLFYWPVSYAQARATLSELPGRPRAALDLGSGPGPVAFAALDAGASGVLAADRSRSALELAKALAMEADEPLSTREWAPERPLPEGPFDLVTMGHVLNELYAGDIGKRAALVEKILERVSKGGTLLVLEPALRETSRALLEVRDVLVSRGVTVRAPCLWRGACPALVKPSDWCHAERTWRPPPMVEAIGRAAGLRKETLKMSYLALAPRGEAWAAPPPGQVFRIVSEPLESKGRQRFMGCGPSGRVGLAMQRKHETEHNRLFFQLQRGDVVRLTQTEERGDGLALSNTSTVEILANAGHPVPLP